MRNYNSSGSKEFHFATDLLERLRLQCSDSEMDDESSDDRLELLGESHDDSLPYSNWRSLNTIH